MMRASIFIPKKQDTPQIKTLLHAISQEERSRFAGNLAAHCMNSIDAGLLFAIAIKGEVIGMCSIAPLSATLVEERAVYVLPEYRGLGLQRMLHEACALEVSRRWGGHCRIVLRTEPARSSSARMQGLGFDPWPVPDAVVFDGCEHCIANVEACQGPTCCRTFLICSADTIAALAARLAAEPIRHLSAADGRALSLDCSSIVPSTNHLDLKVAREDSASPPPAVFWLTGISGAGKTTIARSLRRLLGAYGWRMTILDGDDLRGGLNADLGFSDKDRAENVRRIAQVAGLMADTGLLVVVSCISPLATFRRTAKEIIGAQRFIEVHVDTSIEVAADRDPKGLYALARAGKIAGFTGLHAAYERPLAPQLRINTAQVSCEAAAEQILRHYTDTRMRTWHTAGIATCESVQDVAPV